MYRPYNALNVRRRGFTPLFLDPWATISSPIFRETLCYILTKLFRDCLRMFTSAKLFMIFKSFVLVLTIIINFTSLIVMTRRRIVYRQERSMLKLTYTPACNSSIGSLRQVVLKRQGIVGRVFRITLYSELPPLTLCATGARHSKSLERRCPRTACLRRGPKILYSSYIRCALIRDGQPTAWDDFARPAEAEATSIWKVSPQI